MPLMVKDWFAEVKSAFIHEAFLMCWSETTSSVNPPDELMPEAGRGASAWNIPAWLVNAGVEETPGSQPLLTSIEIWFDMLVCMPLVSNP